MGWVELIEAHRRILNENELDLGRIPLQGMANSCGRDSSST